MCRLRVTMDRQLTILPVTEKRSFEAAGKYRGIRKSGRPCRFPLRFSTLQSGPLSRSKLR